MIGIRKSLDFIFTQRELKILDDVMPETIKRGEEDEESLGNEVMMRFLYFALYADAVVRFCVVSSWKL